VKGVVLYTPVPDVMEKAPAHFPAHTAWAQEFAERGELLMYGTFADPAADGSMGVLVSREAAERFVEGDPFVLEGVVASWRILEWDEVLAPVAT